MIIFCEECGKKYKIDESKIVGDTGRCKCRNCDHIMLISKPQSEPETVSEDLDSLEVSRESDSTPGTTEDAMDKNGQEAVSNTEQSKKSFTLHGLSLNKKLLLNFTGFMVTLGGLLIYMYMEFVPGLLMEQVDLRTYTVSHALKAAVAQPLLVRNYLQVNKITDEISRLPGVAYVSVVNSKGIVIAGLLGEKKRFSPGFVEQVEKKGFPREIVSQNRLSGVATQQSINLTAGGQDIYDVAVKLSETGGEVHVGLFLEDVSKQDIMEIAPLLIILGTLLILGAMSFFVLANSISKPIRQLAEAAQRISLGELDLPIQVKGSGEIEELASSLERMRFSIKSAMERLRRR